MAAMRDDSVFSTSATIAMKYNEQRTFCCNPFGGIDLICAICAPDIDLSPGGITRDRLKNILKKRNKAGNYQMPAFVMFTHKYN
ncbi:hypothetical protein SAMN05216436_12946 [bacterium A37T11]|nr:hypothetical protein SAMN05216436_12946 [bacterium A37T11]